MITAYPAHDSTLEPAPITGLGERLPRGRSILVIAGMSAICWAVLASSVSALWSAI
jgi:hypothetical protein